MLSHPKRRWKPHGKPARTSRLPPPISDRMPPPRALARTDRALASAGPVLEWVLVSVLDGRPREAGSKRTLAEPACLPCEEVGRMGTVAALDCMNRLGPTELYRLERGRDGDESREIGRGLKRGLDQSTAQRLHHMDVVVPNSQSRNAKFGGPLQSPEQCRQFGLMCGSKVAESDGMLFNRPHGRVSEYNSAAREKSRCPASVDMAGQSSIERAVGFEMVSVALRRLNSKRWRRQASPLPSRRP